jgi:DNA-binding IclR family transcriptional regulator
LFSAEKVFQTHAMKARPQTASVVDRVLQVLACVARAGHPIAAKQIAADIGTPLSTVYRHLAALRQSGLLQEHSNTGLFEPGPTGVQLAWGFDQSSHLVSQSRDEIRELVARTGESVGLMVYLNAQLVCLALTESEHPLRCSFARGRAHSMVRGASAKALLAFLPQPLQRDLIAAQLGDDPAAQAALRHQLSEIRSKGYALSESEVDVGVWGVSAALLSESGRLEGALSLMAPCVRAAPRAAEFIRLTRDAAERISSSL